MRLVEEDPDRELNTFWREVVLPDEAATRRSTPQALTGERVNEAIELSIDCQSLRWCNRENFEPALELAVEIAREGREGRRIGTLLTFGDAEAVMERSRPLILDPLAGYTDEERQILNPNLRGTIKELAQLDGAFVVSDDGVVVSACRYLDAMASDVILPYGMGSRHLAGASISQATDAVAIVVSESSMGVRRRQIGGRNHSRTVAIWSLQRTTAFAS